MGGLEADLAQVAQGLWREDAAAVKAAADRVADHPHVIPEQMAAIRAVLENEFAAFAAMDGRVHDAAVALAAAAADSSSPTMDLFDAYVGLQEGCVACHTKFRSSVSEALQQAGG